MKSARSGWRFWGVAYALGVVLAAANLPTPLYAHYQQVDHLSTGMLTIVFVAYVLAVSTTLLVAGQLSDILGRRAVLVPAVVLALGSAAIFAASGAVIWLIVGRALSGVASGALTSAGPAALVDLEPKGNIGRASLVASAVTVIGLASGPMVSGILVQYGPSPYQLVYIVSLPALALALVAVSYSPRGNMSLSRLRLLRRPTVPVEIRKIFLRNSLAFSSGWVGTAMFFALGPTFALLIFRSHNLAVAAGVVFEVFAASAMAQLLSRKLRTGPTIRWGLVTFALGIGTPPVALLFHQPIILVLGALLVGIGQGLAHRASQAALLDASPPNARGQIAAAFYFTGYLAVAILLVSLGFVIDATTPLIGLACFSVVAVLGSIVALFAARDSSEPSRKVVTSFES